MDFLVAFLAYYWTILVVSLIYYKLGTMVVQIFSRTSKTESKGKNDEPQSPRVDGPAITVHDDHGQTDLPDSKDTKASEAFEIEQLQLALKASAENDEMQALYHIGKVLHLRGCPMAAHIEQHLRNN